MQPPVGSSSHHTDVRERSETPEPEHPVDESTGWWAWATAGWLITLAIPLLCFPRLLLFLATPSSVPDHEIREMMTPLENFLALHMSIGLFAVALALITSIPSPPVLGKPQDINRHPLLVSLTTGLCLTGFIAYHTTSVGAPLSTIIAFGSGFTGLWGVWVIMFEGSSLTSKKTGADKRTSAFLFGNKASASQQRKQWKKDKKRGDEYEMGEMRRD